MVKTFRAVALILETEVTSSHPPIFFQLFLLSILIILVKVHSWYFLEMLFLTMKAVSMAATDCCLLYSRFSCSAYAKCQEMVKNDESQFPRAQGDVFKFVNFVRPTVQNPKASGLLSLAG